MPEYIYEVYVTRKEYFYIEADDEDSALDRLENEVRSDNRVEDWEETLVEVRGEDDD